MQSQLLISKKTSYKILIISIIIELSLLFGFLSGYIFHESSQIFHFIFNLDQENNFPALFSSIQLFIIGLTLLSTLSHRKYLDNSSLYFFTILGCAFIFLSFDELFSVHERITFIFGHVNWIPRFKGDHGIWILPYLMIVLLIFILMRKEFLKIWNKCQIESIILIAGFSIFIFGAVVLEIISYQFLRGEPSLSKLYITEIAFEEFFEMIGMSLFLFGAILLRHQIEGGLDPSKDSLADVELPLLKFVQRLKKMIFINKNENGYS